MKRSKKLPQKTAIIYPFLPHYRYGIFKQLDDSLPEVAYFSDITSGDKNIAVVPRGSFRREETVSNKWLGRFLWQQGLGRKLFKYNPDALIFLGDMAYVSTWIYAIIARILGKKVYFWTIGWHRPEKGLKRFVRLRFYSIATRLLLYWHTGRNLGRRYGYPDRKMTVIYNSYDSRTAEASIRVNLQNPPENDRPIIGAVARLSPNKELTSIIETAAILKENYGIDVTCLIVGEGPEREKLESCAKELDVILQLPGAAYHPEDLGMIYEYLTLTIIPKNAGLTVLQSLSAGTPVITISDPFAQGPEFESIRDGVNGSLIKSANPESIAKAVANWLQNDSVTQEELSDTCKKSIKEHWVPSSQATLILEALQVE